MCQTNLTDRVRQATTTSAARTRRALAPPKFQSSVRVQLVGREACSPSRWLRQRGPAAAARGRWLYARALAERPRIQFRTLQPRRSELAFPPFSDDTLRALLFGSELAFPPFLDDTRFRLSWMTRSEFCYLDLSSRFRISRMTRSDLFYLDRTSRFRLSWMTRSKLCYLDRSSRFRLSRMTCSEISF